MAKHMFILVTATLFSTNFLLAAAVSVTCDQPSFTCPGSPVSCECQGVVSLTWTGTSTATGSLFPQVMYRESSDIENPTSTNGYTSVLCNITEDPPINGIRPSRLTSKLHFNLSENINVSCRDNSDIDTVPLQRASSPSPPRNLYSTLTSTGTDSVAVRLDWDPPLNDGGVAITNYIILVNMSQPMFSTDTDITFPVNSTGLYLIEISAVNDCGIISSNISTAVSITDTGGGDEVVSTTTVSTTVTNTMPPTALLTLSTAAVVGVVIAQLVIMAMVYTCGILTGFLLRRRKNNHAPSVSGDLSSPMYEQVLSQTKTSISLEENVAYGQFSI